MLTLYNSSVGNPYTLECRREDLRCNFGTNVSFVLVTRCDLSQNFSARLSGNSRYQKRPEPGVLHPAAVLCVLTVGVARYKPDLKSNGNKAVLCFRFYEPSVETEVY